MEWELVMPCEIGRSLEYRIIYTVYTRLSCVVTFLFATNYSSPSWTLVAFR